MAIKRSAPRAAATELPVEYLTRLAALEHRLGITDAPPDKASRAVGADLFSPDPQLDTAAKDEFVAAREPGAHPVRLLVLNAERYERMGRSTDVSNAETKATLLGKARSDTEHARSLVQAARLLNKGKPE